MSIKPFRNSKSVNRPFCSPFSNTPPNNNGKSNASTPKAGTRETLPSVSKSKRRIFQQTPPSKKLRLSTEDSENKVDITQKEKLTTNDLLLLKQRIQEKQETISNLKRTILYKKKNKAEDLESAISKWTNACQTVLGDYQNHLQERNGQLVNMAEILSSFSINPDIVHFSIDDDTFV